MVNKVKNNDNKKNPDSILSGLAYQICDLIVIQCNLIKNKLNKIMNFNYQTVQY
jgi:hypothetical protein